jgi:hypothetical protein
MHNPRVQIKTEEKERGQMRKHLSITLVLILAATIGLSACAEKKPETPPAAPADNTAPAAPPAPAAPAGGSAY